MEHHLCFHVLIMFWTGRECSNFLLHIAERLAIRRKEPKIKTSAWIKARLSFALIRNMRLCLRVIRTPSKVDNINKICLCAIVAESNIKMNHLQIHSMLLHDCKYVSLHILFVLFLYNFCIYTQSTDDLGLVLIFVRIEVYLKKKWYSGLHQTKDFTRKTKPFELCSSPKFNNLGLAQGMTLKLYTVVGKELKLKIRKFVVNYYVCRSYRKKTGRGSFFSHPEYGQNDLTYI